MSDDNVETNDADGTYPPDPHWGTDARGRFRYTDYDGESVIIDHDRLGNLWIDKRGEGPVFIRQEDIPLILAAVQGGDGA